MGIFDWFSKSKKTQKPSKTVYRRSYASAKNDRLLNSLGMFSSSQDSETMSSIVALRNRARQICRDDDYAKNAIRAIQNNIIGKGIKLQCQVRSKVDLIDDIINSKIENLWNSWSNSKSCSVNNKYTFNELERLAIRAVAESGEVFFRLHLANNHSKVAMSLEIIESDLLDENVNILLSNGNQVRMGIEFDQKGQAVNYYFLTSHPGDYYVKSFSATKHNIIPASEIIHIFVPERPNQTRGITWFHTVIPRLFQLKSYEEAELVSARVSACTVGFIKRPPRPIVDEKASHEFEEEAQRFEDKIYELSAGTVTVMEEGEEFQGFSPGRTNASYESYVRTLLRGASAGIGISYETLSNDYSQSNYSSARLALLNERDHWKSMQQMMIDNFHQKVFESWIEQAVLSSAIILPDFWSNRERYLRPNWIGRGWAWVDPQKEVQANIDAIKNGLSTYSEVHAQNGADFDEFIKRRKAEQELIDENDLIFESDASKDYELRKDAIDVQKQQVNNNNQGNSQNVQNNEPKPKI